MWLVLLLLASGTPSADDVSRAKLSFQAGKAHYQLGNYSDAIREFAAGYALTQQPDFLINLGQAYRAQGDTRKALDMFEKYLEKAPADAAARKQVEPLAAELRAQLARDDKAPADAPVLSAEPPGVKPPPATVEAPAPRVAAPAVEASHHSSPLVWAIPVGAAVVIGAVAAGVAVALSRPGCGAASSLGCIDLR
jgi:tetratricopeptide (TPR) repeat protein